MKFVLQSIEGTSIYNVVLPDVCHFHHTFLSNHRESYFQLYRDTYSCLYVGYMHPRIFYKVFHLPVYTRPPSLIKRNDRRNKYVKSMLMKSMIRDAWCGRRKTSNPKVLYKPKQPIAISSFVFKVFSCRDLRSQLKNESVCPCNLGFCHLCQCLNYQLWPFQNWL